MSWIITLLIFDPRFVSHSNQYSDKMHISVCYYWDLTVNGGHNGLDMSFLGRQTAHGTYSSISSHDTQSLHPLVFQLFSNSASENCWIAHVRARCRNAISSSWGSERAWFKASANSSVDLAWYPVQDQSKFHDPDWKALLPVGCPLNGTMMSLRGPPDACAIGIIPAAYQLSGTMKRRAIRGNSPWIQQCWYRNAHQP